MRRLPLLLVVPALALIAGRLALATDREQVPLFTGDDLDRMFGPAPAGPSRLVDKTRPQDWLWVEQYLDRQYARIDADRQYDLSSREVGIAERQVERPQKTYGSRPWGVGYPALWWNGEGRRHDGPVHRGDRRPTVARRDGTRHGGSSHRGAKRSN